MKIQVLNNLKKFFTWRISALFRPLGPLEHRSSDASSAISFNHVNQLIFLISMIKKTVFIANKSAFKNFEFFEGVLEPKRFKNYQSIVNKQSFQDKNQFFYYKFEKYKSRAVFNFVSGFPFFRTMNFDGSKSSGRSSATILPKAVSKTRLN